MRKIVFYTDKSFLPRESGHLELLYPFWGSLGDPIHCKGLNVYNNYIEIGHHLFEITDNPKIADFALLPNDFKRYERNGAVNLARKFVKKASLHALKTIVFYHSDFEHKIPLKNTIIFRTSMSRCNRDLNEYVLPGWSGDLLMCYSNGKIKYLTKQSGASLGFCGAARVNRLSLYKRIKQIVKKIAFEKRYRFNALHFRFEILQSLQYDKLIKTDFIVRNSYLGGVKNFDSSNVDKLRIEYFENLLNNPYVLCMRGVGNFSYRFYEALSVGRIPVLIDTECVLPFEKIIEWDKIILRINKKDINHINKIVSDHFNSLSESEFQMIQNKAREIWMRYLSPEGFYMHMDLILSKSL